MEALKSNLKQFLASLEPGAPFRRDAQDLVTPLVFQSRAGQDLEFLTVKKPEDGWVLISLLVAPAEDWAFLFLPSSLLPFDMAQAVFMPDSEDEIIYTQISCVDLHALLRQCFPKQAETLIKELGHAPD